MDATRPLATPPQESPKLRAAMAAEAVGIAQRALDLGIEHAKTREQFGKPIGTYQAVSHPLAQTYTDVELARSLAYWAAWCVAEDDERAPLAAAAAKAFATEAAVVACERSIQVHGGTGFTWEHPLHRFYKRAIWLEGFGTRPSALRLEVADAYSVARRCRSSRARPARFGISFSARRQRRRALVIFAAMCRARRSASDDRTCETAAAPHAWRRPTRSVGGSMDTRTAVLCRVDERAV